MYQNNAEFAAQLDAADELREIRDLFHLPLQDNGKPYIYLCGNSLGCQPKSVKRYIETELEDWAKMGVEGHLHARNPWLPYHEFLAESTAKLVGALPSEVVVMNSLTANLHFLMVSFYRPTAQKYKILIESDAFPSDYHAVLSQIRFHGYDPEKALIRFAPREGETLLRTEDILTYLETEGEEIALVLLGGVNYYTGQAFDIETITQKAHEKNIFIGWDLAHATGNLVLKLHDWQVDFAAWCSYKYLNAGPGAVGGCFIHEKHVKNPDIPRFAGWWGHDKVTRFQMRHVFDPIPTAEGWQLSNAPVFTMAALRASMEIFDSVGMEKLKAKSLQLTGFLEYLLSQLPETLPVEIITPKDPTERGCQLSIRTLRNGKALFEKISAKGVICDWREPDVIRVAPVPLYNSFSDVFEFVELLKSES
ncbi:MAG: kynureninase [Bacteroidia bacterium]